jgi:hypothetical protein
MILDLTKDPNAAIRYQVIDLDTGEELNVLYADTEKGIYKHWKIGTRGKEMPVIVGRRIAASAFGIETNNRQPDMGEEIGDLYAIFYADDETGVYRYYEEDGGPIRGRVGNLKRDLDGKPVVREVHARIKITPRVA